MHDVAVVGGGPAGAATALLLARSGRSVTLFEATAFDSMRCGETLPPEINPLLRRLGVWDRFLRSRPLASPGTVSHWDSVSERETDFTASRHGCGWHVDRNVFDRLLCEAAARAGVDVVTNSRVSRCTPISSGWRLEDQTGKYVEAGFLVDAGGRNGVRLPQDEGRRVDDTLIALFAWYDRDARDTVDMRTAVEATPEGWWYSAPIPGSRYVAAYFVDPRTYREHGVIPGRFIAQAAVTQGRLANATLAEARVVRVSSSLRRRVTGLRWAAVGDAAASYDPISGRGISQAISDAFALTETLTTGSLAEYAARVERAFTAYARERAGIYQRQNRWPGGDFWRNRSARSE